MTRNVFSGADFGPVIVEICRIRALREKKNKDIVTVTGRLPYVSNKIYRFTFTPHAYCLRCFGGENGEKNVLIFVSLMNTRLHIVFRRIFVFVFNPLPNDHTSRALLFYDKYNIVFHKTQFLRYSR